MLNLGGRLLPGHKTVLSVVAAVEHAPWLTSLDLSDNDLRSSGTLALCNALLVSSCQLSNLVLARNSMGRTELVHKPTEWPDASDMAKSEALEERRAAPPVLRRNFSLR